MTNEDFTEMNQKQQDLVNVDLQPSNPTLDRSLFNMNNKDLLQVDWCFYTGDQMVDELTRRDVLLMQAISIEDIDIFTKNQKNKPDSIRELAMAFDGTTKWIIDVILCEKDLTQKRKRAKHFLLMGRTFYLNKNYHTAMQFVLAFSNAEIEKLFQHEKVNAVESEEYICIFNPLRNYAKYRQNLFSDDLEHISYFPAFPILLQDAVTAIESGNQQALPLMIDSHFKQWSAYALPVLNEKNQEVFNFVSRFRELSENEGK